MMTLQKFIEKWNNRPADFDGSFGNQCMDLMHFYIVDVLGIEGEALRAATAYEAYQKGDDRFEKIPHYSGAYPQAGDIIFWGKGLGESGHVAVFIKQDGENFYSFDQNWPFKKDGSGLCHAQSHNYKDVVGWLRFKTDTIPPDNQPIKRYMNIVKTGQMIWTKDDNGTHYWVIYKKNEGEVKRAVVGNVELCSLVFALNDQYRRWETPEQLKMLAAFPIGQPYDIKEQIANHPELLEKQ